MLLLAIKIKIPSTFYKQTFLKEYIDVQVMKGYKFKETTFHYLDIDMLRNKIAMKSNWHQPTYFFLIIK